MKELWQVVRAKPTSSEAGSLGRRREASESGLSAVVRDGCAEIPEGINAVVISRTEPLPEFAELQARGALTVIGWNDLRLTFDETRAMCAAKLCGLVLASVVVLLALVPHSQDVHGLAGLDFEQRYVARRPERNDEFSQEWVVRQRFPARERREAQYLDRTSNCSQGAFCGRHVLLQQEAIGPQQIVFRLRHETNRVASHLL
jgi:hypothetical protein